MNEFKRKRGRPEVLFTERRDIYMKTRMSIKDMQILNELSRRTGLNKANVVRRALRDMLIELNFEEQERDISDKDELFSD